MPPSPLSLLDCDAPAQVNIDHFNKAVLEPGAQGRKDLTHQQVSLFTKVSEGAGEEYTNRAIVHQQTTFVQGKDGSIRMKPRFFSERLAQIIP